MNEKALIVVYATKTKIRDAKVMRGFFGQIFLFENG